MSTRRIASPPELASWHAKIHAYGSYLKSLNPTWDSPDAIMSHADELLAQADHKMLKAQSREADVWVRETLTAQQQLEVVCLMVEKGVHSEHLPRTASRARLTRLIGRGALKSQAEISLVRSALDAPALYQLSPKEISSLGSMFDEYSTKLATEAASRTEA